MFTKVDNVLIANGTTRKAEIKNLKGEALTADDKAAIIRIVGASENVEEMSNLIQKASHPRFIKGAHKNPVEAKIEIDLTNTEGDTNTIVIGHRYVLRIVYKDMYEAPGQFTHTYEVVANSEKADDLGDAFAKKINKHPNRRVNATYASKKLTLTAMPKDDNEGVNSINEYTTVSMVATLYYTIPGALLSNQPENVPGVVITTTEGEPGVGYWKQVRDLERRAMGYKGHVFTDAYPVVEQERKVEKGAEYNYLMIEFDNVYLSPDNQYLKTTPIRIQLFDVADGEIDAIIESLKTFGAVEQTFAINA